MDSPWVGPTYPLKNRAASIARTVNLMPISLEANERVRWVLKDVPGLVKLNLPRYYTSWPYPIFADESLDLGHSFPVAGQLWRPPVEELDLGHSIPVSATLVVVLHEYSQPAEELDLSHSIPISGTLVTVLREYSQPAESMDMSHSIPTSGTLVVVLVSYSQPAEEMDMGHSIPLSGTLA